MHHPTYDIHCHVQSSPRITVQPVSAQATHSTSLPSSWKVILAGKSAARSPSSLLSTLTITQLTLPWQPPCISEARSSALCPGLQTSRVSVGSQEDCTGHMMMILSSTRQPSAACHWVDCAGEGFVQDHTQELSMISQVQKRVHACNCLRRMADAGLQLTKAAWLPTGGRDR
jgi:hypothetical protein